MDYMRSKIQGDALCGLDWILDGQTLHKSWSKYPEWDLSLTHFLNEQCVHVMFFMSFKASSFVLICPFLRQIEVSVW